MNGENNTKLSLLEANNSFTDGSVQQDRSVNAVVLVEKRFVVRPIRRI